ncbi:MAG: hypothetical protein AAGA93_09720 [Actinomycetota bacterium]
MTDDLLPDDPPPVAEYRDPELTSRFATDSVPGHQPGFWTDLEAKLGVGQRFDGPVGLAAGGDGEGDDRRDGDDDVDLLDPSTSPLELVGRPASVDRRRSTGRWLAAAAAALVVAVGGAVLVDRARPSSVVESATPEPTPTVTTEPSTTTVVESTTTTEAPASSTTTSVEPSTTTAAAASAEPVAGPVGYFDGDATVRSIGPGEVVGFSPDGSAALVVDDAPGPSLGCEGAEHLMLYTQSLATGERRPAIEVGPGEPPMVVETGGIELAIAPFDAIPPEVATRPVYWLDWCDGVPGAVHRGVLSADGTITRVEALPAGEPDPFGDDRFDLTPAPDGRHGVAIESGAATVVELDGAGQPVADGTVRAVPAEVADVTVSRAVWSPDGQAVALGADDSVVLWSPWTGEHQRFVNGATTGLAFGADGRRLAVVSRDRSLRSSVLTFGDLPDPVAAPARCSGRVELTPLSGETLLADGIAPAVAATLLAVDDAATTCDWDVLGELAADGFVASFGGGQVIPFWQEQEAAGRSPMWFLRVLVRQPFGIDAEVDPALSVWPSLHLETSCDYTPAQRRVLAALGYDPALAAEGCRAIGGYGGYRTGIDADGVWRFFVEGD